MRRTRLEPWCDTRRRFSTVGNAVAIGLLLITAAGCGSPEQVPPPGLNETQLAGWQVYVDLNCAACHGENREGKRSGPPLIGLAEHWTSDEIVDYLSDPDAMMKSNPRLAYKAEQYAIGMPKVSGKTPGYSDKALPEKLEALAGYLLVDAPSTP